MAADLVEGLGYHALARDVLMKAKVPPTDRIRITGSSIAVGSSGMAAKFGTALFITRKGVNLVLMKSGKPIAQETRQWLAGDVMPAIAAWRVGRHPSLQVITQLIEAGYDVDAIATRHGIKDLTPPSKVKAETPNDVVPTAPFNLEVQVIDGEPRVLDTDLATQLGMSRPRHIRGNLIEPNREELEGFGSLPAIQANGVGRPSSAFYLNRQQALLVCILSKTPRAREVRAEVIRRFDAYEAPQVAAPVGIEQMMAAMTASMTTAIAQAMQVVLQASGKAPVVAPQVKRVIPERMRSLEIACYQFSIFPSLWQCGSWRHGRK